MIEFMKFIGGVVLSAAIIAPAFAFILKSFAHISGSKPTAVPATPERSGSAKRTRAGRQARRALAKLTAVREITVTVTHEETTIAKRGSSTTAAIL